eukprot:706347-Rhodomonas_salina.1
MSSPTSSRTSRAAHSRSDSPSSIFPFGQPQQREPKPLTRRSLSALGLRSTAPHVRVPCFTRPRCRTIAPTSSSPSPASPGTRAKTALAKRARGRGGSRPSASRSTSK